MGKGQRKPPMYFLRGKNRPVDGKDVYKCTHCIAGFQGKSEHDEHLNKCRIRGKSEHDEHQNKCRMRGLGKKMGKGQRKPPVYFLRGKMRPVDGKDVYKCTHCTASFQGKSEHDEHQNKCQMRGKSEHDELQNKCRMMVCMASKANLNMISIRTSAE
nr:hypothetical protein CFP56_73364 [Quercus suber]